MKALNVIALILVILGGLDLLILGLFEYDVVSELFGGTAEVGSKIVYIIIGVAALWALTFFSKVADD